jgi:hypothetical protein
VSEDEDGARADEPEEGGDGGRPPDGGDTDDEEASVEVFLGNGAVADLGGFGGCVGGTEKEGGGRLDRVEPGDGMNEARKRRTYRNG